MSDYHIPLLPGAHYHIVSRAIGDEKIFREKTDYDVFFSRFEKHVVPVAEIYSYCLLPNHIHFLVRIKEEPDIVSYFKEIKKNRENSYEQLSEFIMERFSNLLNSYTKWFNKKYSRRGGLFIDYLRRVEITSESQLAATIFYIHKNPVHHHYCDQMDQWPWSSYSILLSDHSTNLVREQTFEIFGGVKGFNIYHSQPIVMKQQSWLD